MNKNPPSNDPLEIAKKGFVQTSLKRLSLHSYAQEFEEEILPKLVNGDEEEKKEAEERFDKRESRFLWALESEAHVALMESFNERFHGWLVDFTSKTIKEYDCSTEVEKSLAALIASSHIRIMDNSKRLNEHLNLEDTTRGSTRYLEALSKQIERVTRQYIHAVLILKQLKAPAIEMHIKTQTAFVSQNQQINVEKYENEIIKP